MERLFMPDSQTEEQKILIAAKKVANSAAFPRRQGDSRGMNYEQYLIGQTISGISNFIDNPEVIAKRAIGIASATIVELAKQQMVNEDGK